MKCIVENNPRFIKFGYRAVEILETESRISKRVSGVSETD